MGLKPNLALDSDPAHIAFHLFQHPTPTITLMHARMTTWVSQVNDATGFLRRLYTDLKDPDQRARADAAGAFAKEQRRAAGRRPSTTPTPWVGLPADQAERAAWTCAVRGLLGLNLLVALGDPLSSGPRARPLRQRLNQDLASALRGFATAFPRDIVEADLDTLCEEAIQEASEVAETAWKDVRSPGEPHVEVGNALRAEWLQEVRPNLQAMLTKL